jgi:hypothetical protein
MVIAHGAIDGPIEGRSMHESMYFVFVSGLTIARAATCQRRPLSVVPLTSTPFFSTVLLPSVHSAPPLPYSP